MKTCNVPNDNVLLGSEATYNSITTGESFLSGAMTAMSFNGINSYADFGTTVIFHYNNDYINKNNIYK